MEEYFESLNGISDEFNRYISNLLEEQVHKRTTKKGENYYLNNSLPFINQYVYDLVYNHTVTPKLLLTKGLPPYLETIKSFFSESSQNYKIQLITPEDSVYEEASSFTLHFSDSKYTQEGSYSTAVIVNVYFKNHPFEVTVVDYRLIDYDSNFQFATLIRK